MFLENKNKGRKRKAANLAMICMFKIVQFWFEDWFNQTLVIVCSSRCWFLTFISTSFQIHVFTFTLFSLFSVLFGWSALCFLYFFAFLYSCFDFTQTNDKNKNDLNCNHDFFNPYGWHRAWQKLWRATLFPIFSFKLCFTSYGHRHLWSFSSYRFQWFVFGLGLQGQWTE